MSNILILIILFFFMGCHSESSRIPERIPDIREMNHKENILGPNTVPVYSYRVTNRYPHDPDSFTQGLVIHEGHLYEGTGLWGKSQLKKIDLETGKVLKHHDLDQQYFGEGITILGGLIYQLTYQSNVCFVYDLISFSQNKEFPYSSQGWGLTNDGRHLIMSNGSSVLSFRDPETFKEIKTINVRDPVHEVDYLNELEYIDKAIYANIWQTEIIAIISPDSGNVTGWIDLSGLNPDPDKYTHLMNGIAFYEKTGRLIVTGKYWPDLYEIEISRINSGF